ncbi:sodium-translocating pyrophosphatase [Anaerolentibacter hominis]|uniref:sodium-translocating pyrophosphatase n=1 Tax=Anaerolentibacter hominis TaxID=3079009 RepID=UPI0031B84465
MIALLIVAIILALSFACFNYFAVKKRKEGTEKMAEVAGIIHEGAQTFVRNEYRIIAFAVAGITALLMILISWYAGCAFLIGTIMSALAGYIGMKIATIANVRVSNEARETKKIGRTLKVAFQGGSVMGLCVAGFALLGLLLVYLIFGMGLNQLSPEMLMLNKTNWLGISFIPFAMSVTSYALGCSIVAMFNRVGGGIYTKAADMGADLVGKTEVGIPEDDYRNPATIADNVGDNVGDVAGLGSDLLESFVGAIVSGVVFCVYTFMFTRSGEAAGAAPISDAMISKLVIYPVYFAAAGLVACVLGIAYVIFKKQSENPHKELNTSLFISAFLTIAGGGIITWLVFRQMSAGDLSSIGFQCGFLSPWFSAVVGIVAGIVIGLLAEYYTSYDYKSTREVANTAKEGTALVVTSGLALGMKSAFFPVLVLAATTIAANALAGLYGVAMAAVGMLSFVAATVSVDTYGPIADNAGGISEMCELDEDVRHITDQLDSVGNTTAAVGKGFAIGSAALAALSLLASFIHTQGAGTNALQPELNIVNSLTLAGAFVGAVLPYLFSGMLIKAVAKSAGHMVDEVRRQFKEKPGIMKGTVKPDYNRCIEISSKGALAEMKMPVVVSIATPLVSGFLFGADFVGGVLIGATISAIMLALFTANAGGAWDNAKKFIESGSLKGEKKGGEAHSAAVVGDTIGDPLKDTVGPSLDILIKIMATVSLIAVCIFGKYNLLSWLFK